MSENKFGEPWSPDGPEDMRDRNLVILSSTEWNRAVACVNACAGIGSPFDLRRQLDGLVDIVNRVVSSCEETFVDIDDMSPEWKQIYDDAKKALADVGGGKGKPCEECEELRRTRVKPDPRDGGDDGN